MGRTRTQYSIAEKRQALTAYCVLGSFKKAAIETGIPHRRIADWSKTDWWEEWEAEVTAVIGKQTVHKMRGAIMECYDQIHDRLENGDVYGVDKDGEAMRAPASLKTLSMAANVGFDKVRLYDGHATSRTEKVGLDDNRKMFEQLAEKYADKIREVAGGRPIIEGETVKAVPANQLPGDRL